MSLLRVLCSFNLWRSTGLSLPNIMISFTLNCKGLMKQRQEAHYYDNFRQRGLINVWFKTNQTMVTKKVLSLKRSFSGQNNQYQLAFSGPVDLLINLQNQIKLRYIEFLQTAVDNHSLVWPPLCSFTQRQSQKILIIEFFGMFYFSVSRRKQQGWK